MRISVALCTYNGEKYLQQQLESIAAQSFRPYELVVCDDISEDCTLSILAEFAEFAPFPVKVIRNEIRLGVTRNFFKAIQLCSGDFVALSDQDDVWLPTKLERAALFSSQTQSPERVLYFSRFLYVDSEMKNIAISPIPSEIGFHNAVAENIAVGCTAVFGANIREKFLLAKPGNMIMHDWWLYLVASTWGELLFDAEVTVLYRQHGENVTGREPIMIKLWNRFRFLCSRLFRGETGMDSVNQATRFLDSYQDVPIELSKKVEQLTMLRKESILRRLHYLRKNSFIKRNNVIENIALKVILLMGLH